MEQRELTDEQWEALRPHLPPAKPRTGRPNKDHRTVVEGILWKLRTGAPWRDLPERYGPWQTVYDRFLRWRRSGLWDRLLQALQRDADRAGELVWEVAFVDRSIVPAHQHAAGAPRRRAKADEKGGARRLRGKRSARAAVA